MARYLRFPCRIDDFETTGVEMWTVRFNETRALAVNIWRSETHGWGHSYLS